MKLRQLHHQQRNLSAFVKVRLSAQDWRGHADETLWAQPVAEGRVKLKNVPFYAYGVSYNDVLHVTNDEATEISIHAGHSTYRFFVLESEVEAVLKTHWRALELLGCTYERGSENLFSVDVPPEADIHAAYAALEVGERDGVWEFEEGKCGHPV